jgi:hypothetical protein
LGGRENSTAISGVIFPAFPRHFTGASKIKQLQTRVVNIMVLFGRRKIGAQFTGNFRSIVSPAGNEDPPAVGEPLRWNQRGRRAKSGSENDERRHKQRNGTTGENNRISVSHAEAKQNPLPGEDHSQSTRLRSNSWAECRDKKGPAASRGEKLCLDIPFNRSAT